MRKFLAIGLAVILPAALPVIGIQVALAHSKPAHQAVHQGAKTGGFNLADGKQVYQTNCATCHGTLGSRKPTLPNAANFFAGQLRLTHGNPALMAKIIKDGGAKFGHGASPQMPSWGAVLSAKQVADVAAFELSLHKK